MDIKKEMENNELKTARGRREFEGKGINLQDDERMANDLHARRDTYMRCIRDLKREVHRCPYGIGTEELEAVEFVIEQLERLAVFTVGEETKHIGSDNYCY